mmetsp:Transcript_34745/g.106656  ORF Transcript_34745/g.106656 Transcript_34745/m.106656 type:complete len:224 (+) Transcript_34745:3-674(+)
MASAMASSSGASAGAIGAGYGCRDLSAVGRLDKATTGLLLLTDDGDLDLALRDSPTLLKAYVAVVAAGAWTARTASNLLMGGVTLSDGPARAVEVEVMGSEEELRAAALRLGIDGLTTVELQPATAVAAPAGTSGARTAVLLRLADGRNRVVRRMLAAAGLPCLWLHRVAYGPLELGALGLQLPREYRPLSSAEVDLLRAAAVDGFALGEAARAARTRMRSKV